MSERHTIKADDLEKWLRCPQWQVFASSFCAASNKKLEVDAAADGPVVFRVTDHDETKFLGTDRIAAIDAYNEAP